jgi:hypothetical protein
VPAYEIWGQVAGYFDIDGTVALSDLSNLPYKLSISLILVDQSYDQIKNVRDFLQRHGIKTSNILKHYKLSAYMIAVSEYESVKKMLRGMLPFLCKKANEARAALDYYEDRMTGNELNRIFKEEVEAGRRERRPHRVVIDVPYTRTNGLVLMKTNRKATLRDAFGRFRSKVAQEDFARIREEHFGRGRQLTDLIAAYPQYSKETIRRILGRDRGYVGVKGIGRVDTTDTTIRDPRPASHG